MEAIPLPDIEKVRKIINEWVTYYPRITKVYLFGSYVKKNKSVISDIDIAIEISERKADTAFGFWCSQAEKMRKQLTHFLNYKIDLWRFAGEETPHIKKGLDEGHIVIYERIPK